MRSLVLAAVSAAVVIADHHIPFSPNLGCGACVGSGNVFCQTTAKNVAYKSTCCEDKDSTKYECALKAVADGMTCASDDDDFKNST